MTSTEIWMPEEVESIIKKLEIVPISTEGKGLKTELNLSDYVGLSVLQSNVVCLTTKDTIYVFHPNSESHALYLKRQLSRPGVKFFTPDGVSDADLLLRHMKINLAEFDSCYDLVTFDVTITLSKYYLDHFNSIDTFSMTYVNDRVKPREHTFQELVKKWLNKDVKLECTNEEIDSIRKRRDDTLTQPTKNAIRKTAGLVQAVAQKMAEEFENLSFQHSQNILKLGVYASDEIIEDFYRREERTYPNLVSSLNRCTILPDNKRETEEEEELE